MSVSVMKKLTVLTPLRDADRLVRQLMRLRCVELRSVAVDDLPDGGRLLRCDCEAARAEAERRVADVTAALALLDAYTVKAKPWRQKPIVTTAEAFRTTGSYDAACTVVKEVREIESARAAARHEYNRVEALRHALAPWLDYDLPLGRSETDTCEIWQGVLPPGVTIEEITDQPEPANAPDAAPVRDLHMAVEEITRTGDGEMRKDAHGRYVSVILLQKESDDVARALAGAGFTRIQWKDLPSPGTARENDALCVKRLGELENQLQSYTDRLRHLSQMLEDIRVLYDMEMTSLEAARQRQKLASTEQCAVLEGWVPGNREEKVSTALDKLFCAYDMAEPEEGEEPPVLLENNGFASNFEWVVGMYAYPKYGTFDPTAIMSIFYFFIFGVMFADVGYGLLLLLGGLLLPKLLHMKGNLKRMLNMFGYCGISCMALGVVFGGWFGDMPYALMTGFFGYTLEEAKAAFPIFNGLSLTIGGEPVSLNPLENPMAFLVISLAIGAVHLIAGMAIKFWILCKQGHVFAAIFDIGSYWVLFAGLGLIFFAPTVGWIVLGVGALMIVCTYGRAQKNIIMKFFMGLKGLYDLISYASDLLSYCRILALGLAAGVVGQVINLLATMGGPTPGGFVLLVLVMLLGHALNMAINVLGSFVHTSRLQYLEFFGKFYEDGGVAFEPALPSDKYSTVELEPADTESDAEAVPADALPHTSI